MLEAVPPPIRDDDNDDHSSCNTRPPENPIHPTSTQLTLATLEELLTKPCLERAEEKKALEIECDRHDNSLSPHVPNQEKTSPRSAAPTRSNEVSNANAFPRDMQRVRDISGLWRALSSINVCPAWCKSAPRIASFNQLVGIFVAQPKSSSTCQSYQ